MTSLAPDRKMSSPAGLARGWALVAAVIAALAGFEWVYGLRLVRADDPYWSNPPGDMGQMLAGELAGLRAPWSLPILTPDTLTAPDRVSLVYTDSIPWMTALLKLLHLGPHVSLLGGFLLLAWLAQPLAMYALLRASGVRRASTLLAGCLLALATPAWLSRQMGHIALSGHAVQIAALALAVHGVRRGLDGRTVAAFVGLAVFATGVHAYHIPPVTLLFAAALASDILQRRPGGVRRAGWGPALYLSAVGVAAWVLGYFVGRGGSGGTDALGIYEMNLFSPVFPDHSGVLRPEWLSGGFIRAFGPATPQQEFEGYNYVGLGVGFLLIAAAGLAFARRRTRPTDVEAAARRGRDAGLRRWGPLAVALLLLTLYALGTKPYAGPVALPAPPLPHAAWMEPLALFRAHGRFFWTVGYAALAGALVVVDRARAATVRLPLLAAAVALQALDTQPLRSQLHARFARPEPLQVPAALRTAAFRGRDLRLFPGFFCTTSDDVMIRTRQLSLLAQRNGASSSVAETARAPAQPCPTPAPDLRVDAAPGDRRVTVVQRGDLLSPPVSNAFARRSDCFAAEGGGVWFCGRDLAGTPGLHSVHGLDLATPTHQDAHLMVGEPAFRMALGLGWSAPEPTHVWSDGPQAVLRLPHPALGPTDVLFVTLDMQSYRAPGRPPQRVRITLPDGSTRDLVVSADAYRAVIVPIVAPPPKGDVRLVLSFPDAAPPPSASGASARETRALGVGLRAVTLSH